MSWSVMLRLVLAQVGIFLLLRGLVWLLRDRLKATTWTAAFLLPWFLLAPWIFNPEILLLPTDELYLKRQLFVEKIAEWDYPHGILNDSLFQFLPWELEVRRSLKEGQLPLWSDRLDGGSSPWANPQAQVLSPTATISRALFVPIQHHILFLLALQLSIGALGCTLLGRRLGAREGSALLGGLSFALSGGMMAWAVFPHTAPLAWAPWHALAVLTLVRRGGRRAWLATVGLTVLLAVAGHPEIALAGGLFSGYLGFGYRRVGRFSWPALGSAALVGTALAAPLIIPFAHGVGHSQRYTENAVEKELPSGWIWERGESFFVGVTGPNSLGRPYHDPYRGRANWNEGSAGYAGLLALLGAMLALGLRITRRRALVLGAFSLGVLTLAAGFKPLLFLIHILPGVRGLSGARFLPIGALALCLMGALGWNHVRGRFTPQALWITASTAALSLWVATSGRMVLLWFILALLVLLVSQRSRLAAVAVAAILVLDLGIFAHDLLPRGKSGLFYPDSPLISSLRKATESGGPWRVVGEDYETYPSLLTVYGFHELRPNNPMVRRDYLDIFTAFFQFNPTQERYFDHFRGLNHPLLDFLNVKAVVSNRALDPLQGFESFAESEHFRFWRNPDALPRYFGARWEEVSLGEKVAWFNRLEDPRIVAVDPEESPNIETPTTEAQVELMDFRRGRVRLQVRNEGASLLATSLPEVAGWRVLPVGGRARKLTVNHAFLGAWLEAGVNEVVLEFRPPGWTLSWGLAFSGFLALGVGMRRRFWT